MNLLYALQDAPGKLAKEDLLQGSSITEQSVFYYAYNPDLMYGVKFQDYQIDFDNLGESTTEMFEALDHLAARKITGLAARNLVEDIANTHGDLIKLICNKDLDCGVTATTINKVFPGTIPQFKLQLAKEVPIETLKYPLLAQTKYDGVRIAIIWTGNYVEFKTRNGKVISLPTTSEALKTRLQIAEQAPCMIDSEVTLKSGLSVERSRVSGMINSARSGTKINESLLAFNCFDLLPLEEFNSLVCSTGYKSRAYELGQLCRQIGLLFAETTKVNSVEEVQELYAQHIEQGLEGLILKPLDHLYTYKRSKDWVKLKEVKSADLQCVDIVDGTGKYQGMIGALVCQGTVEGKQITVNVGSGLTDADRAEHQSEFISHTIEIKYNSVIQDSVTKEWSLFLPRFVMVRHDK